jgi:hypothetical protein
MKEICVLMLHHQPLSEPLLQRHIKAARDLGLDVFPLSYELKPEIDFFEDIGLNRDGQTPGYGNFKWSHMDFLVYEWWFSAGRPLYERYLVVEYDTLFTEHPRSFYGPFYDDDAVAACVFDIRKPESHWPGGATFKYWFDKTVGTADFVANGYGHILRGMMPIVCLFSHRCLSAMAELFRANPWTRLAASELRCGSLAAMSGHEPSDLVVRNAPGHYYQSADPKPFSAYSTNPGIWHPVKDHAHQREWEIARGAWATRREWEIAHGIPSHNFLPDNLTGT